MSNILCFGDSITQGYTDVQGGWTQRLRQKLDSEYFYTYKDGITVPAYNVFNLGISGDTSTGLLKRMASEIKPRLLNGDNTIIIATGTNDSVYRDTENNVETTEEQFRQNLTELINVGKQTTNKLILVGTLPCDESKMQPMPWSSSGRSYSNDRLSNFNKVIVEVGKASGAAVVNMFDNVIKVDNTQYLHDGIHPNATGHQMIADSILSLLVPMLSPIS